MASAYPSGTGSNIGTLLRMIQEDKNQAPAAQIPASDPNSPLRELVQSPLQSPNDPNSDRVVSLPAEGINQPGSQGGVVAPAAPSAVSPMVPGGVVAPAAPIASMSGGGGSVAPNNPTDGRSDGRGSMIASPQFTQSAPNIGTRITSFPAPRLQGSIGGSVKGVSNVRPNVVGKPIVGGPTPTPAPTNQKKGSSNIPWNAYIS